MTKAKQEEEARPKGRAISDFFSEIGAEFKRITWPHGHELIESTIVVLVFIVALSATVYIFDSIIRGALTWSGFIR